MFSTLLKLGSYFKCWAKITKSWFENWPTIAKSWIQKLIQSYLQKLANSWPKLALKVDQLLTKVKTRFGSIMGGVKCTFHMRITIKSTLQKGTPHTLQKSTKSYQKLDSKVDPKLPRKVGQKLTNVCFKSWPKLDTKIKHKLTL